jgi:hypothetical protein
MLILITHEVAEQRLKRTCFPGAIPSPDYS